MFPLNENHSSMLANCFRTFALTLCVALAAPEAAAEPVSAGDIVVVSVRGEVRVTMLGTPRAVQAGVIIQLPAAIHTGHDGAIDLRQGNTTVAIAAHTEVKLPATAEPGATIDRLIQARGNVFYDVGTRESRKLRVETPYLVAVIKGTQFNVAVQEDSSTISLFEGRLEVRAPDDSDVVDLNAGEIAIRHAADRAIRVLRMDGSKPTATTSNDSITRPLAPGAADPAAERDPVIRVLPGDESDVRLDVRADVAVDANVDLGSGTANVGADTSIGLGAARVYAGLDTAVDLGAATLDAAADTSVDLGAAAAYVSVDAAADLGAGTVDVGTDTVADLGVANIDTSTDVGVDLGAAAIDAGADVAADLGVAPVDAGVDLDLEAGAPGVAAGLDSSVAGTDVDVDLGVDLGSGDLGADVSLGGLDIGLGTGSDTDTSVPAPAPPDTDNGGLLGGLLGGRRSN